MEDEVHATATGFSRSKASDASDRALPIVLPLNVKKCTLQDQIIFQMHYWSCQALFVKCDLLELSEL